MPTPKESQSKVCAVCCAAFHRRECGDSRESLFAFGKRKIDFLGAKLTLYELSGMLDRNRTYLSHRIAQVGVDGLLRGLGKPGRRT